MKQPTSPEIQKKEKTPSLLFTDYYVAVVFLLVGAFIATAYFLIRPQILKIKETNAQTDAALVRLSHDHEYLSSLEQSVSAAQSIDPTALKNVSLALPDVTDTPSLLMQLSAAGTRNGVQVLAVQFGDVKLPTPIPGAKAQPQTTNVSVPFDISLTLHAASYFSVKRFLADVESSLRLMDVTGITLSPPDPKGGMNYQLQLRTYIFHGTTTTTAL